MLFISPASYALDGEGTLTLESIFDYIEQQQAPDLRMQQANIHQLHAKLAQANSINDLEINLIGHARYVEPNELPRDQSNNDSFASLELRKKLYDSGHREYNERAFKTLIEAKNLEAQYYLNQKKLTAAELFFKLITTETRYLRDTEAMMVAFEWTHRARQEHSVGKLSTVDLRKKEAKTQQLVRIRAASAMEIRNLRTQLALNIGYTQTLPAELTIPKLNNIHFTLPDMNTTQQEAISSNLLIKAIQKEILAEKINLKKEDSRYDLQVLGYADVNAYNRDLSSRDEWRVGIAFKLPLFSQKSIPHKNEIHAKLHRLEAKLEHKTNEIKSNIYQIYNDIELQESRLSEVQTNEDYKYLELDRSRALYEVGYRVNIGNSMTETTGADILIKSQQLDMMQSYMKLNNLIGRPLLDQRIKEKR